MQEKKNKGVKEKGDTLYIPVGIEYDHISSGKIEKKANWQSFNFY